MNAFPRQINDLAPHTRAHEHDVLVMFMAPEELAETTVFQLNCLSSEGFHG